MSERHPAIVRPSWRVVLLLTSGAALLRLLAWHGRGDLWLDEAWLALNVVDRSFAALLTPLAENQSAPLLWLWVTKAVTLLPIPPNVALRLSSFLAGVALVPVAVRLSGRFLRHDFALMAGVFVAGSPLLVRYSVEAKPYLLDALVALGLALLLIRLAEQPTERQHWRALSATIVIAPLASISAVFVVPAVLAAAWWLRPVRAHPRALAWLAGSAAASALLAIAQYLAMLRSTSAADYMQGTWAGRFLQPGPVALSSGLWSALGELTGASALGVADEALPWVPGLLLVLVLVGGIRVARQRGDIALQVVLPLAAAALASTLHKWPMHPRLLLFLAPWVLVLLAAGFAQLGALVEAAMAPLRQVVLFASLLVAAVGIAVSVVLPPIPTHLQRVVREIETTTEPPDVIWFDRKMIPACEFYTGTRDDRRCTIHRDPVLIVGEWIGPSDMGQLGVRRLPSDAIDWAVRERARIDSAGGVVTWAAVAPPDERAAVLARMAADAFDVDTALLTRGAVILRLRRR